MTTAIALIALAIAFVLGVIVTLAAVAIEWRIGELLWQWFGR